MLFNIRSGFEVMSRKSLICQAVSCVAEVDEAAWSALYSTKSQVFPKPKSGKVAIKVINHYGDEVLKIFEA